MSTLEQRVQAIEQLLGEGLPDSLNLNVLSLNAKGQVEETLSGKLKAKGIIIPAGFAVSPSPGLKLPGSEVTHEIVWEEEGAGMLAEIEALRYSSLPPAINGGVALNARAYDPKNKEEASLSLSVRDNPSAASAITAKASSESVTLIDSGGSSSFLQGHSAAGAPFRSVLVSGIVTVEYPGSSENSKPVFVPHNVPNPKGANYFGQALDLEVYGYNRFAVVYKPQVDGAQFYLVSTVGAPPAGWEERLYWLAVVEG